MISSFWKTVAIFAFSTSFAMGQESVTVQIPDGNYLLETFSESVPVLMTQGLCKTTDTGITLFRFSTEGDLVHISELNLGLASEKFKNEKFPVAVTYMVLNDGVQFDFMDPQYQQQIKKQRELIESVLSLATKNQTSIYRQFLAEQMNMAAELSLKRPKLRLIQISEVSDQ